jgi:peptidoglycan/LPS O-acetylase OafA/YrhL
MTDSAHHPRAAAEAFQISQLWRPIAVRAAISNEDQWAILAGTRFVLANIVYFSHIQSVKSQSLEMATMAAVLGFFMVSGFSIAHSISSRPKGYIRRRIWRIWPTYLFSFFVLTLPAVWLTLVVHGASYYGPIPKLVYTLAGNLFMLQGLLMPSFGPAGPTWTLAIEEWFYLFAPLLRRLSTFMLCVLIVASARWYLIVAKGGATLFPGQIHGVSHTALAWSWLIGFVFFFHRDNPWARLGMLMLPVFLVGLANYIIGGLISFTMVFSSVAIVFANQIPLRSERLRQVLSYLGNLSYPLYVLHIPVFTLLDLGFGTRPRFSAPLYTIICYTICALVYRYIDAPNRISGGYRIPKSLADAVTDEQPTTHR